MMRSSAPMTPKTPRLSAKARVRDNTIPFFVASSLIVVALAWIIRKDIQLPSGVILGIGAAGLLLLFVSTLRKPELALFALAAYLPFNRVLVGDFGTEMLGLNLTNLLMGLASIGWFLRAMSRREPIFRRTALNGWIALFVLLGLISVYRGSQFWSGSSFNLNVFVQMKRWFTPMWLFFIGANLIQDRPTIKRVMLTISFAVVVIALMAVRDYSYMGHLGSLEKARISGVLGHSNALGAFFAYYMFLMAAVLLTHSSKIQAWALLLPLAICFRGIMVTFSRGAYLAFAAGGLSLCFFRSKRLFLAALMVLAAAVVNPWMLPSGVRYRFAQTVQDPNEANFEQSLEGSSRTRLEIWRGAIGIIRDYPLWGAGFETFNRLISRYTPQRLYIDAHNTYLLVAAEMGLPALGVFLIILLLILAHAASLARRSKDRLIQALGLGVAAGTSALLVSNLFGSRMNAEDLISYFWLLAGLVVGAKVLVKRGVLE